jgi:hypothetical protein
MFVQENIWSMHEHVCEFRHQKPKGLTGNSLARETILAVLARDTREPWLAPRPV